MCYGQLVYAKWHQLREIVRDGKDDDDKVVTAENQFSNVTFALESFA